MILIAVAIAGVVSSLLAIYMVLARIADALEKKP